MFHDALENSSKELRRMVSAHTLLKFTDGKYHLQLTLMPLIKS